MKKFTAALFCLVVSAIYIKQLYAQNYVYAIGNPTFSTQIPIENGFINVNNGEIHIEIPLATHPQRGRLQLDERLVYDSRIWKIVNNSGYSWQPTNVPNSMGGWTFQSGQGTGRAWSAISVPAATIECGSPYTYGATINDQKYQFFWTDPAGTTHQFNVLWDYETSTICPSKISSSPVQASGNAIDSSGYTISLTGYYSQTSPTITIYDRVGNEVYPAIQDPNGNYFSSDSNGNLVDTLGRTPTVKSTNGNQIYYDVLTYGGGRARYTGPTALVSNIQYGPNGPLTWQLANGLTGAQYYDGLGRVSSGWVCKGSSQINCSGGTMVYGFDSGWQGPYLTSMCDSSVNECSANSYDNLGRLASVVSNLGLPSSFGYVYDRYGNRWQQNVTAGSGSTSSLSFDLSTNRISAGGYSYDAAGNLTSDGFHSYTYDAEGNITAVDGGNTASYVYDALNHKIRIQLPASQQTVEYVYDAWGRITSLGGPPSDNAESHIFWDGLQIAFRAGTGLTFFTHKDWVNTDRVHTDASGASAAVFTSAAFGDGGTVTSSENEADWDFHRFGDLDYNAETATNDAHFRQYSPAQGRWMSPDPYDGSYDFSNPQSLNRYSYVMNNPLSGTDPTGQIFCGVSAAADGGLAVSGPIGWAVLGTCVGETIMKLFDWFGGPSFHGTLKPRPEGTGSPDWANVDASLGETLGLPSDMNWSKINPGIAGALGLPDAGCEFGACGAGPSALKPGQTASLAGPILIPPSWLLSVVNLFHFPYADSSDPNHRLFGTHYCGPGGGGAPTGGLDQLCAAHDACYRANGVSAIDNLNPFTSGSAMGGCDRLLCTELGNYSPTSRQEAVGKGQIQQIFGCGYINK